MKRYKDKKVLVTGGTGFIGARLAERLFLEEGADVTVLVNRWYHAAWVCRSDVKLIQVDITDAKALEAAVEGSEIVFHCVGVGGDRRTCDEVNAEGTRNVLEAAARGGVDRIVYLSTIGVHGPFIEEGLNENSPFLRLGNEYADSKIQAEEIFWGYVKKGIVSGSIIRPTYVWGPRSAWFTVKPAVDFAKESFYVVDNGKGACNAVHVDNVVDITLIAGINDAALGEAFLITDGERRTWEDFFSYYARMASKNISDSPSIGSAFSPAKAAFLTFKGLVRTFQANSSALYWSIEKKINGKRYKLMRAPFRLMLGLFCKLYGVMDRIAPEPFSLWDLKKFSSTGHIDISKANKLLGYQPRVSVEEGMKECKNWLRDQNFI